MVMLDALERIDQRCAALRNTACRPLGRRRHRRVSRPAAMTQGLFDGLKGRRRSLVDSAARRLWLRLGRLFLCLGRPSLGPGPARCSCFVLADLVTQIGQDAGIDQAAVVFIVIGIQFPHQVAVEGCKKHEPDGLDGIQPQKGIGPLDGLAEGVDQLFRAARDRLRRQFLPTVDDGQPLFESVQGLTVFHLGLGYQVLGRQGPLHFFLVHQRELICRQVFQVRGFPLFGHLAC